MRRREFIKAISASAVMWPVATWAQQPSQIRRVGILGGWLEGDPQAKRHLAAFVEGLRSLHWIDGENVHLDYRSAPDVEGMRARAAELLNLRPDLVVTNLTPGTAAMRQASPTMQIVFIAVSDPIGAGFVESFSRPGGNITGFTNTEPTMGGKWFGFLLDIAPSIRRVAMLFNPETANAGAAGGVYLKSIETAAQRADVELIVSPVHDPTDIDEVFARLSQNTGGGVVVTPSGFTVANRGRIAAQAAQYRIPTIYPSAQYTQSGGLLSYGVDSVDLYRQAASYVDRILKGAKPADLPVQAPTKYEMVINLKTAKTLGLDVPPSLLTLADEVIE